MHGEPIVGKALAWTGLGDARTASLALDNRWFVADRIALGAGLTGTFFDQAGGAVVGAEARGTSRWYVANADEAAFFWDLDGGYLQTTERVPADSTEWNMTFAFGPGFEVALPGGLKLLSGIGFHHLSNALGRRSPRNESQNEIRLWIGVGSTW